MLIKNDINQIKKQQILTLDMLKTRDYLAVLFDKLLSLNTAFTIVKLILSVITHIH